MMTDKKLTNRKNLMLALLMVVLVIAIRYTVALLAPATVSKPEVQQTIICVGDSITYGSGVGKHKDTQSYPALLQSTLGDGFTVINFGVSNKTAQTNADDPYVKTDEYQKSLVSNPNVVLLMLGTNDTRTGNWDQEAYKKDLTELVKTYQGLTDNEGNPAKVYLMIPPAAYKEDGSELAAYTIDPKLVSEELPYIITQVSEETGASLINLYNVTCQNKKCFADGVHPNKDGYKIIAWEILSALDY